MICMLLWIFLGVRILTYRVSLQIWCSRLIKSGAAAAVHNTDAQVCFTNPQPACICNQLRRSQFCPVLLPKQHLVSLPELCQLCRIMVFICTKLFFIVSSSFTFEPWISMTTLTQMIVGASTKPNEFNETLQELLMLSSVTLNCQVTKIVTNPGSQLSEL